MDWSKTKTIFIGVFLVLNIFLYWQYLNSYNESKELEVLGEKTKIEAGLKEENITYIALPNNIEAATYISGKVKNFQPEELPYFTNQAAEILQDNKLVVTIKEPIKLRDLKNKESYTEFLHMYVHEGTSYVLWSIDEENREATFFQHVNNRILYYNISGFVKIHWNVDGEVFWYEQSMIEKLEELGKESRILPPIQIIQNLYSKNLLKTDAQITAMKLGYSTLQQTQTQVFAPTWEVRVNTAENTEERYFVNAVDGNVIDLQYDLNELNEVEE